MRGAAGHGDREATPALAMQGSLVKEPRDLGHREPRRTGFLTPLPAFTRQRRVQSWRVLGSSCSLLPRESCIALQRPCNFFFMKESKHLAYISILVRP